MRALTLFDYLRIRRRLVNSPVEASSIRHLRCSRMLLGVDSYRRFGTKYRSEFQGTSSLEITPEHMDASICQGML